MIYGKICYEDVEDVHSSEEYGSEAEALDYLYDEILSNVYPDDKSEVWDRYD